LVNSYLIHKGKLEDTGKRAHRNFREALSKELRNTPYLEAEETINKRRYGNSMPAVNQEALAHNLTRLEVRKYCIWCKEHPKKWNPKSAMPVLSELVNREQSRKRKRQSRSQ
jgi:hypothetical protein